MGRLYLTRHGETIWNREERLQGRSNSNLTDRGREQAKELAVRLQDKPLSILISSPSERALSTAQIVNQYHHLPVVQDEHFLEMDLGEWEGQLKTKIDLMDQERARVFWEEPHLYIANSGEDFYQVRERVLPRLKRIMQENPDEEILLVTHAVVLKTIMTYFENRPLEKLWDGPFMHGTSLTVIDFTEKAFSIRLYADTSHFSEAISF